MKVAASLLIFLSFWINLRAQDLLPVNRIDHIRLVGMVNLKENGALLVSADKNWKSKAYLTLIDTNGASLWKQTLALNVDRKKNISKIWVGSDANKILWIRQSGGWLHTSLIDLKNGKLLQAESKFKPWPDNLAMPVMKFSNDSLYFVQMVDHLPVISHYSFKNPEKYDSIKSSPLQFPQLLEARFLPIGFDQYSLWVCVYTASASHAEILMSVKQFNLSGQKLQDSAWLFTLKDHVFAFNGVNDRHLLYAVQEGDHINLIGKLEAGNQPEYKSRGDFEKYAGFWMARINLKAGLTFFRYYSFRNYREMLPAGTINRPIFLDYKEDEKQNLYLQLAEIPDALSYYSYLFEINPKGDVEFATGGLSEYNFFQFNAKGVHHIVSKSKMRLTNDEWRYYGTNFLDEMKPGRQYPSKMISHISRRSKKSGFTHDQRTYNFILNSPSTGLVFEYLQVGGGRMNIYKIH